MIPELSIAVGSIQIALMDVEPNGTVSVTGSGQLLITGGVVSCSESELKKID